MGLLFLVVNWFPANRFGFIISLVIMLALFGMTAGGVLAGYLSKNVESLPISVFKEVWRNIFFLYALIASLITIMILLFVTN